MICFFRFGGTSNQKYDPKNSDNVGVYFWTDFVYQSVFSRCVFGTLQNKSVKPKVEISNIRQTGSQLSFQLFRVEGADVYGSFLIGIQILDENNQVVKSIGQDELAQFPKEKINNHYVAKIKSGKHSLILPLGAKADITIDLPGVALKENYALKLIDISGIEWSAELK